MGPEFIFLIMGFMIVLMISFVVLEYVNKKKRLEKLASLSDKQGFTVVDTQDPDLLKLVDDFTREPFRLAAPVDSGPHDLQAAIRKETEVGPLYFVLMLSGPKRQSYLAKCYIVTPLVIPAHFNIAASSILFAGIGGPNIKNMSEQFKSSFIVDIPDGKVKEFFLPGEIQDLILPHNEQSPLKGSLNVRPSIRVRPNGICLTRAGTDKEGDILLTMELAEKLGRVCSMLYVKNRETETTGNNGEYKVDF